VGSENLSGGVSKGPHAHAGEEEAEAKKGGGGSNVGLPNLAGLFEPFVGLTNPC
jgi:hypothetical protein